MSAREIQDQKTIAREMFVQQAAYAIWCTSPCRPWRRSSNPTPVAIYK